jgi:hypothetical protein
MFALPAAAITRYAGMCDASAAVMLDSDRFVAANDEDNILRVYSLAAPGKPVATVELGDFLHAEKEADIEGAARVGDRIYWIGSHGANKNGKPRPDRRRFFATDVIAGADGASVRPAGTAYSGLPKLFGHPIGVHYKLSEAALRAPESRDALNIEGLAADGAGGMLIGFRNPVPGGRALIVPLKNPQALVDASSGGTAAPEFGKAIELDLGGLGIRSIEAVPGTSGYLIVAGPARTGNEFALFGWREGAKKAVPLNIALPAGFRPEALMIDAKKGVVHLLSDDGDACTMPAFRLLSLRLPTW